MPQRTSHPGIGRLSLRKLHSLTGFVPLGIFMVVQLVSHAKALDGEAAYGALWQELWSGRAWLLVVLVPLAFHAGYGLRLAWRTRRAAEAGKRDWRHALQALSGIALLVLSGYWLFELGVPLFRSEIGPTEVPARLVERLSATTGGVPLAALGTLVGFGALAYHFGYGIWSAGVRWGIWTTRVGRLRASLFAALLGLATLAAGARTVVFLATGWRLGAEPPAPLENSASCGVGDGGAAPASSAPN